MDYKPGQRYDLKVIFAQKGSNRITVDLGDKWSQQVIEGNLSAPLHTLKDKKATFVCREVTEEGPFFDLAPEYFARQEEKPPAPSASAKLLPKIPDVEEGEKVEFKSSIIYSPNSGQPDSSQPFAIAKEIAAFMNTDGGTLYLGVKDNGTICGVESDLPVLNAATIKMPNRDDADFDYKPNRDHYCQKLRNLIRYYLGDYASSLIKDPEWRSVGGKSYAVLTVPATGEDIIYLGRNEHLVYRTGSESVYLIGRARDQYTKFRFHHGAVDDIRKVLEEFKNGLGKEPDIKDLPIPDNSSLPLDKTHLEAIRTPAGLVFEGNFFGPADSWGNLYLRLLEKLATHDPEKFEALPDEPAFRLKGGRKPFARKGAHVKLSKASPYLGRNGDIRADLADGTKAAFQSGKGLAIRLIEHFGLKPEQFRIWTGQQV